MSPETIISKDTDIIEARNENLRRQRINEGESEWRSVGRMRSVKRAGLRRPWKKWEKLGFLSPKP